MYFNILVHNCSSDYFRQLEFGVLSLSVDVTSGEEVCAESRLRVSESRQSL